MTVRALVNRTAEPRGFTLVEFAIVMLIGGLMLAAAIDVYRAYRAGSNFDITFQRLDTIKSTISSTFQPSAGRYPCPADPVIQPNATYYGVEVCPDPAAPTGSCWTLDGGGAVIAATTGGVCVGAGGVDTAIDADTDPANDHVLIGMYPYKTVIDQGVTSSVQHVYDGWSRQISYVVTASMTDRDTFEKRNGSIRVVDETGNAVSSDGIHFALLSHGENGRGAYSSFGFKNNDCTAGTIEFENCNGDGIVLRPILRTYSRDLQAVDDVLVYTTYTMTNLWTNNTCKDNPDDNSCIHNVNSGFVGVGIMTPAVQKLDIAGNIRTTISQAEEYCGKDDNTCFQPGLIGGTVGNSLSCDQSAAGPNQVMVARGIRNNQLVCVAVNRPGTIVPGTCPSGQFIVGFNSAGEIICREPVIP